MLRALLFGRFSWRRHGLTRCSQAHARRTLSQSPVEGVAVLRIRYVMSSQDEITTVRPNRVGGGAPCVLIDRVDRHHVRSRGRNVGRHVSDRPPFMALMHPIQLVGGPLQLAQRRIRARAWIGVRPRKCALRIARAWKVDVTQNRNRQCSASKNEDEYGNRDPEESSR